VLALFAGVFAGGFLVHSIAGDGVVASAGGGLVDVFAVYFKGGYAKVEIGLGRGRKVHDKREEIKRAQDLREAREAVKQR